MALCWKLTAALYALIAKTKYDLKSAHFNQNILLFPQTFKYNLVKYLYYLECHMLKLCLNLLCLSTVGKGSKIRNRYNQVPHLTQDTNGKVTNSQLDTINESQEASPFPARDHRAHINRRAQRHSKHKTEKKHKRSTKEVPPWNGQ